MNHQYAVSKERWPILIVCPPPDEHISACVWRGWSPSSPWDQTVVGTPHWDCSTRPKHISRCGSLHAHRYLELRIYVAVPPWVKNSWYIILTAHIDLQDYRGWLWYKREGPGIHLIPTWDPMWIHRAGIKKPKALPVTSLILFCSLEQDCI